MELITYGLGDISIRHSMIRLFGYGNISKQDIFLFLQNEKTLNFDQASAVLSADRCCLYIEGFKAKRILLNSEHFLITLIAVAPHNFVERNYLCSGYAQHLQGLRDLLQRNVAKSIPVFEGAKIIIDYFHKHQILEEDSVNLYILLYNLLICHSNYFLVLEDTDSVDGMLFNSFMGVTRHYA